MNNKDHIKNAQKLVQAIRNKEGGNHQEELLDGIENHIDALEENQEEKYIVFGHEDMHFANVCIVKATTREEAIEKANELTYLGYRTKAKPVAEFPKHGDVWAGQI